jgi:phosphate/sulfate permease
MGTFLLWVVFSFIVGIIAAERKIGFWSAFFISLILSPLIGLILTFFSKSKEEEAYQKSILITQKKQEESLNKLSNSISISDELSKLKKLREDNSITDEEFQKLRSKIINS